MAACMFGNSLRYEVKQVTPVNCAPAEVNILEPQGPKLFIESTQIPPNIPAQHQECTGRLLNRNQPPVVQIKPSISPIYPVPRADPI
jgi:hypothetical protein